MTTRILDGKTYGLGYTKDPAHKRTQALFHLILATAFATALPMTVSLRQFECARMDQGQTGSCTGHGTAQGLAVSCGSAGIDLGFVASPNGIYGATRCEELPDPTAPLTDSGTMPADVMVTLQKFGVRAIQAPTSDGRYSDVEPANVNDKPTLDQLEAEGTKLVVGEYRIDETASNMPDQICAALAGLASVGHELAKAGTANDQSPCAVGIGVFVDTAFMQWTPANGPLVTPPNQNDPNGGGHWIAIVGYTTLPDGKRVFDIVNSWGSTWGDGTGHIQVHEDWLRAAVSDIYVLTARLAATPAEKAVA